MSQTYSTDFSWQLPAGFYFNTDFVYTINNQLSNAYNINVPFWNASISKLFLPFNRGEIKLKAYDLLNRNVGVSRNSNQNYIEDITQRNLQRFFLVSFTYSLAKNGLSQVGGGGVMRVVGR